MAGKNQRNWQCATKIHCPATTPATRTRATMTKYQRLRLKSDLYDLCELISEFDFADATEEELKNLISEIRSVINNAEIGLK
jgi:hypothetical protein